jgi:hypothetical protein
VPVKPSLGGGVDAMARLGPSSPVATKLIEALGGRSKKAA